MNDETVTTANATEKAKTEEIPRIPEIIGVLPLKNTVMYPFTVIPLSIGEQSSIALIDEAVSSTKLIACVAMKDPTQTRKAENLYQYGTVANILRMMKLPDGTIALLTQGVSKIRVEEYIVFEPYIKARIQTIEESDELSTRGEALFRNVLTQCQKIISLTPYLPDELQATLINIESALRLVYLVCSVLKLTVEEKQQILEIPAVEEKLEKISQLLSREIEILELGGKIKSQVETEMSKTQREYFLREQLKAIQQELGEGDERQVEIKEIREKLDAKKLSEEVRKEADRELERLGKLPPASAEYHVIRTYLDWIIDLPWGEYTEDHLDLEHAQKVLDEDHYDLKEVKERIVEYLAVRKRKPDMKGPILCFVGPPGTGKTSLGQSIARALGRKFVRMSLGGVRDEAEIRGHRRTYIGALPGRIIQSIRRAGSANPVFMMDEVDKVGADFRGDPSSALLEVLDPEQNSSFRDHYLDLPFDLSQVMFITTANILQTIHPALQDRMEILRLAGYTEDEKLWIAKKYLLPRQLSENGLESQHVDFEDVAIRKIINSYTREAGVRNLERTIARVCRKVALEISTGKKEQERITEDNLGVYLGPEKHFPEVALRTSSPGVATGLAWTETGGDVLFIEALAMPGGKNLTLTGQLGDVMQESAKAALSFVRSRTKELGIPDDFFANQDIHVHVPAGAIPKDGPSAGITMAVAIASLLTNRPVREDVAMTGEITLSGLVLPIGGVKEKILAAKRAGIKTVILPKKNEKDLVEIEEESKAGLSFVFAENIDDVFKAALTNGQQKPASKQRSKRRTD
ncbi:MAG: endopeptidase La [Candidatus Abyssobacteria bacterium SURF_17]|uniref:Lon protease n=1 Tax=Candidatus Abyssobacteria bacterium SURF_17 TaxID=2093361 RepID=A0A419EVT5_9BACT|nr:MAG: endopeptidase La [Candidatus Abyssubacteria bacterium SURF_17]